METARLLELYLTMATPLLLIIDKSNGSITLKGGPFGKASYIMEQFHFHFGCDNNHGSEHTVDGTSYPSEVFCFC